MRAIAEDSPIAVCIVGLDGRWIAPHKRICEWLGYEIYELERLDFQSVTHPDDLELDLDNVRRLINREANHYQMEKRYLRKDGGIVWVRLTVTSLVQGDRVVGFVSQIENISDRKEYEAQLKELTLTDPLTGLGNRRHFDEELKRHWGLMQRHGEPFGLIMIDFNSFKKINDGHSHFCGDMVLKDGAKKLTELGRAGDLYFRQGGDELAVIMPNATSVESAVIRIENALRSSIECEGQTIYYSCSVGGATCDRTFESLEQLYRLADGRMMAGKRVRV